MTTSTPIAPAVTAVLTASSPNSKAEIERRVTSGHVGWVGPLVLVFGRTALCVLAQTLVSILFWLRGHPTPW